MDTESVERNLMRLVILVLLAAALAAGCGVKNGLEIGPISFAIPMGAGTMDPSVFANDANLPLLAGSVEQDLCNLPTEDQLTDVFRVAGNIDLSSVVRLSRVQLRTTVIRADRGDFRNVKAIQLYFVPRSGGVLGRVNLGGAFSLSGFGDAIEIEPRSGVDLLELIRENESLPGTGCPKLLIQAAGTAPDSPIDWQAEVEVDAYARLGLF